MSVLPYILLVLSVVFGFVGGQASSYDIHRLPRAQSVYDGFMLIEEQGIQDSPAIKSLGPKRFNLGSQVVLGYTGFGFVVAGFVASDAPGTGRSAVALRDTMSESNTSQVWSWLAATVAQNALED